MALQGPSMAKAVTAGQTGGQAGRVGKGQSLALERQPGDRHRNYPRHSVMLRKVNTLVSSVLSLTSSFHQLLTLHSCVCLASSMAE